VDQQTSTRVDVTADVQVGGAIARVGQRLLEGVGRTMMNRFFDCLGSRL
jgi:carbon monoxide dehydrogenase subunit G